MELFARTGFNRISSKEATDFLIKRHYSGRKPNVMYSYGYFEDGYLVACCTFGKPASNSLCVGVCGEDNSKDVIELNRLCVDGLTEISLSKFLSNCLKEVGNKVVVSYADTQMNHNGYIYQATNFIYTGKTKQRTDKYVEGNKHSRHYDNNQQNGLRKVRSAKHRYIFITGSKKYKRYMTKNIKYKSMPYPKGNNERYDLGSFIEPKVIYADKENQSTYQT